MNRQGLRSRVMVFVVLLMVARPTPTAATEPAQVHRDYQHAQRTLDPYLQEIFGIFTWLGDWLGLRQQPDTPTPQELCGSTAVRDGSWPSQWIHGHAKCDDVGSRLPYFQVDRYNVDTWVLRQNKCVSYEAPFMYLMFGEDVVALQDTGSEPDDDASDPDVVVPLRETVEAIIAEWLEERGRDRSSIELLVYHSHAHSDHIFADYQFQGQPHTTVVGHSVQDVKTYFGIVEWPTQITSVDLGGRTLGVVPIPGHEESAIAVVDCQTQNVLTGDSIYPGRLYIMNGQTSVYYESMKRLSAFVGSWTKLVLGNHIEMTNTPRVMYPIGESYQPHEHPLPLRGDHIKAVESAFEGIRDYPRVDIHDDWILWPK